MFSDILLYVVVITTTRTLVASKNQPRNSEVNINNFRYTEEFAVPDLREKRMILNFAKLGQEALNKLLKHADSAYSSGKKARNYEKEGDLRTAMRDFYSVRPVKVFETTNAQGVKIIKGKAGDRSLSLQTVSFKGYPILDIIDYKARRSGGRYIDRIMYKTKAIKRNENKGGKI